MLLCYLLVPISAVEQAVVLLGDDTFHTFEDVSGELERLGLLPAEALLLTRTVNDAGRSIVGKGSHAEMAAMHGLLSRAGFAAEVLLLDEVDRQIRNASFECSHAGRCPTQAAAHDVARDDFPECTTWVLAGGCGRHAWGL